MDIYLTSKCVKLKENDNQNRYLTLFIWFFQAVYNVISYDDRMRVKTAIELLKATDDIEKQVEKVSAVFLQE